MILKTRMLGQTYEFKDVKDVLAKASEKKSGDELAGVGAESALERIAAKEVLAQLTVVRTLFASTMATSAAGYTAMDGINQATLAF